MCGIAGVFHFDHEPVAEQVVDRMCRVITHRGPDDQGVWVNGPIGIGMRRLSIIDLSSGHQPMFSEDGRMAVVFNGEIYNFASLREELAQLGHVFSTHSDTEVIVHAYEAWGAECVKRFVGMFGIALWDKKEEVLFLARDPLGIKPLYFTFDAKRLLFGSEIKSLLEAPGFRPTLSYRGIDTYFAYGQSFGADSIYEEVEKLMPGEYALISAKSGMQKKRYWQLSFDQKTTLSEAEYIDALEERLLRSVEMHMVSDVPLGAFLSGGVDSSLVVAAMAAVTKQSIKTFTIGFPEQKFDESPFAQSVANHFQTDHHVFTVEPDHLRDILPKLAWHFDEPFADGSAVPVYYLSKMTRDFVTVALSGDGGDELFAGYPQHLNEKLTQYLSVLPERLRRGWLKSFVAHLPDKTPSVALTYRLQWLKKVCLDALDHTTISRFFSKAMISQMDVRKALFTPAFHSRVDMENEWETLLVQWEQERNATDPIEWAMGLGTLTRLPDDMLVKVDRASMANSLEVRVPFLDHTLVEFAASIPIEQKLKGFTTKYLLKKLLSRHLPKELVYRRKKGFNVPLNVWFRGDLANFLEDIYQNSAVSQSSIFDSQAIHGILKRHREGQKDFSSLLYSLTFFILWYDQYQDHFVLPH